MHRGLTLFALTLLVASSCLVPIEDAAEPAAGGAGASAGSAGSDASAGGGSSGSGGSGGSSGSSGSSGASGSAGAGAGSSAAGAGAGGGSAGAAGSSGTGGASGDCVLPFKDDFEDGTPASFWQPISVGAAAVTETGGKLSITFPETIDTFTMAGYYLEQPLDLSSCSVLVRVDETPPSTVAAAASFLLFFDANDYVEFVKSGSTLHFQYFIGGQQFYLGGQAYSQQLHLWWRFRHAAGILSWETSSNGKQWAVQAVTALPAVFSGLRIGGNAYLNETGVTGSVKFDDFGIPP
jgi:hypothetical protein